MAQVDAPGAPPAASAGGGGSIARLLPPATAVRAQCLTNGAGAAVALVNMCQVGGAVEGSEYDTPVRCMPKT